MGVSVVEGTIVEWKVAVGDSVEADQTVCDISTDKIDSELPAPVAGVVSEILIGPGETVPVGTVLARIGGAGPAGNGNGRAAGMSHPVATRRYSPVVQRIAGEHGIDLEQVTGTGRGGRVRKQDVLAFVSGGASSDASRAAMPDAAPEPPLHIESPYRPDPAAPTPARAQPGVPASSGLSPMRRQIGAHMKRSLETAATCTTWIEVDMTWVERTRRQRRLTALAYVSRAVIEALQEHPSLNATLDGEHYVRHDPVHLGIAVALGEDGLIVPVIRDAHLLSAAGIGARVRELARRARARELTPDEVGGGTFTITNPGQYGSIMATPIINQPQVAILDLEAIVKRPVVLTGTDGSDAIAIRPMTILGLSWDHRALDGAQAAQFLAAVKRGLEEGSAT
jgi:pyruvate/2-oxoglutarate dehydrogenase complex dihydrolipoamide acyltransferase (E2) component